MLSSLAFYGFALLIILSALMVISARNTVHSVLFLIFCFFNGAGLFVLTGAEFVSMVLLIVYVGAVAVLFIFVVMMLDMDKSSPDNVDTNTAWQKLEISKIIPDKSTILRPLAGVIVFAITLLASSVLFSTIAMSHDNLTIQSLYETILSGKIFSGEYITKIINQGPFSIESMVIVALIILSLLTGITASLTLFPKEKNHVENTDKDKSSYASSFFMVRDSLWATFITGLLFIEFMFVLFNHNFLLDGSRIISPISMESISNDITSATAISNTHKLGAILYSDHIISFQIAGVILLLAMIGAIVLTLHHKTTVKRQNIADQIKRTKAETCSLKSPKVGSGVNI